MPAHFITNDPTVTPGFAPGYAHGEVFSMTNHLEEESEPHLMSENLKERPHVLIVEDSRTQAAMLRVLLSQSGYEVTIATNGHEAIESARERKPHLIISDIIMPVLDGYQMCRTVKNESELQDVPVMLLTALWDPTDIVRGLQAGADYYLTKPYDSQYLLSTIESILTRSVGHHRSQAALDPLAAIEVEVAGQIYKIGAGRRQMLNLLLSTYGNAVEQNRALLQAQSELRSANGKLVAQRQQIEAQERELREVNALLRNQATRDSLTGLRNRRALKERMAEEIERSLRHHEPLSLLLLDVDSFKQFNDTFGHPAGDEVLRQVSRLMEEQARVSDFVARYGGEEFVILLPDTQAAAARLAAERVRAAIETFAWDKRIVTASIGIATLGMGITDATTLLARADVALYASKSSGRNRVTHTADIAT